MLNGAYGVMVVTRVCGTRREGSIPSRHPNKKLKINYHKKDKHLDLHLYLNY